MRTKNGHCSEHKTFPAGKMIPFGYVKRIISLTQRQKKIVKKIHTKRSRRYLKKNLD